MPRLWMAVPNGTPPELEPYVDDPEGLERFVREIVEGAGARLEALFFDVARPTAFALVEGLDEFRTIRAVRKALGAEVLNKLLTVEQAVEATEQERAFRRRPQQ
jgi:hypothetical protein